MRWEDGIADGVPTEATEDWVFSEVLVVPWGGLGADLQDLASCALPPEFPAVVVWPSRMTVVFAPSSLSFVSSS
jgi:hypothetical protein